MNNSTKKTPSQNPQSEGGVFSTSEETIELLIQEIHQKIPKAKAGEVASFAREFSKAVAWQELKKRPLVDLYGLVLSNWGIFAQRLPEEMKITLYNPTYEQQGWQSTHTIVSVIAPDIPFLVDSVRMIFDRQGITTHLILHCSIPVTRDEKGTVIHLDGGKQASRDACLYLEIDKQTSALALKQSKDHLSSILLDVWLAVCDWKAMLGKANELLKELSKLEDTRVLTEDASELSEIKDFIAWIVADNFTFLGCQDYILENEGLKPLQGSGLGILQDAHPHPAHKELESLIQLTQVENHPQELLTLVKSDLHSTVHRPAHMDFVAVKRINSKGKVTGIRCFLGLYTSIAYNARLQDIPILRRKVSQIFARSKLSTTSHSGKELMNILENYPRDEFFQANMTDLFNTSIAILQLQERKQIRLFVRKDTFGRFISCLVFIPRDRYETNLRQKIQNILKQELGGERVEYFTTFSESVLARTHYIVHLVPAHSININVEALEKKLIEAGRSWEDNLKIALIEVFGEAKGTKLFNRYTGAFPIHYQNNTLPQIAVSDIKQIEQLEKTEGLTMRLYRPLEAEEGILGFKLFRSSQSSIPLSDVVPILENMGLRILSEHPYKIVLSNQTIWLQDFSMRYNQNHAFQDLEEIKNIFHEAFAAIWFGNAENDGFNRLVLAAGLSWRETALIRAYAKYLQQAGFTFSQSYTEQTLASHSKIVKLLIEVFHTALSPSFESDKALLKIQALQKQIQEETEAVESLDEDRILRRFTTLIQATLRTNFYQTTEDGQTKPYISFKLNPHLIPEMPLPRPAYEIFVYSPTMEGVHLRGGKIARGGIRWSDRREDFRTEVLGLMKAQQVKNAVIVPVGAKGGFVIKRLSPTASREVRAQAAIDSYSTLIRGLLDITDNLKLGKIVPPPHTIRKDEDDPYLVVAADKGTATFSDHANSIAKEYDFWLGDAFASGGSYGFDHKKMGITAKGVWESVRRHFREMGINVDQQDITVIGIGDMSGDVFGNGMLMSEHIKLVGAFNHQHIFLDPNPDPKKSYPELKRLFNLPRSSWEDYNPALLSPGGGVFRRSLKSITLSPEIKKLLNLKVDTIEPNHLIKTMLHAPVDLLYNGGIGTYVKSITEKNEDVGDRNNDALRINGKDLRCKVVVEGGNLGLTQLGRVEYVLGGGRIYTDFIDNSGGVNCSDNEVNIKILLNEVVASGDLTEKQRQKLLSDMTDEVAKLVIRNNYRQTQALSIAESRALARFEDHIRLIHSLEKEGKLDRKLEGLPTDEQLVERKLNKQAFTGPEIAILLAYTKNILQQELTASHMPDEPYFLSVLESAFPKPLVKKFQKALHNHRLRREIIATQVTNQMVNEMGVTFVQRLKDETGANSATIACAYSVARAVFDMEGTFNEIQELDNQVPVYIQIAMMLEIMRLVRRSARWFLKNFRKGLNIQATIQDFTPFAQALRDNLTKVLTTPDLQRLRERESEYTALGVPQKLAERVASVRTLFSGLDIIQAAKTTNQPVADMTALHFEVGNKLKIEWLREQAASYIPEDHWESMALTAFRDDLDYLQSQLTSVILQSYSTVAPLAHRIDSWLKDHETYAEHWHKVITELSTATGPEFALFPVAIKELFDLVHLSREL